MENLAEIKYNIKRILVLMAIDDRLPMDMTELDMDTIFDTAVAAVKAGDYLVGDEEEEIIDQVHAIVREYNSGNETGMIDHIDGVWVCEKFEYSFTVKDFLDQIDYI